MVQQQDVLNPNFGPLQEEGRTWYVLTTMRRTPAALCRGVTAMSAMMVEHHPRPYARNPEVEPRTWCVLTTMRRTTAALGRGVTALTP